MTPSRAPAAVGFRYTWVAVSIATVVLIVPASALSQDPPPPADEYTETVPTGDGSTKSPEEKKTPLPPETQAAVDSQAGADATLLKEIATSSRYGAPQREPRKVLERARPAREPGRSEEGDARGSENRPAALSATIDAVAEGSRGRLVGLLAFMATSMALMIAVSLRLKHGRQS